MERWIRWPETAEALIAAQRVLAGARPEPWRPPADPRGLGLGACFVCFERGHHGPGWAGERGWAGASLGRGERCVAVAVAGEAGAPYEPGLLALREAPLLARAVEALPDRPDVLIVDATGRDHPRRAGLALHLGATLGLPSVGVTHRTLVASGDPPVDRLHARSPIRLGGELVGWWIRTRAGTRPLAVHAAWRTDPEGAAALIVAVAGRHRTPQPLRIARRAARTARADALRRA